MLPWSYSFCSISTLYGFHALSKALAVNEIWAVAGGQSNHPLRPTLRPVERYLTLWVALCIVAGTRELVIPGTPFLVAYRVSSGYVDVVAILHGAWQWPTAFDK